MIVRPYRPEDKPFLQNICRVTAHEGYKKSPALQEAVTVVYNDYYTECEPERVLVAANDDDEPVGYVLCCADPKKFSRMTKTVYKKRLNAVCKGKNIEFIAARLLLFFMPKKYRVHLHIDILPEYQRQGIGRALMDELRDRLHRDGIPYLSVLAVSTRSDGYRFYKKYGFDVIRRLPGMVMLSIPTER